MIGGRGMNPVGDLLDGCRVMRECSYMGIHWDFSGLSGCVYARDRRDLIVFFGKSFCAGEHKKIKRFNTMRSYLLS